MTTRDLAIALRGIAHNRANTDGANLVLQLAADRLDAYATIERAAVEALSRELDQTAATDRQVIRDANDPDRWDAPIDVPAVTRIAPRDVAKALGAQYVGKAPKRGAAAHQARRITSRMRPADTKTAERVASIAKTAVEAAKRRKGRR